MLNSYCKNCNNQIKCNQRYVNAKKGDKIFCPDGSIMFVDQNYQMEIIKPKHYSPILKVHYCESCAKYGRFNQIMKIIQLDEKTMEQKLRQFNLGTLQFVLAKNFYDFVECPVCKWYKFVKRK